MNVDELLQPIMSEIPSGVSTRSENDFSNPYYQLKHARHQARTAERARMQQGESTVLVASEWYEIESLAKNILKNQFKDLEVASWLLEAWFRVNDLEGLMNGIHLITGLIENFGNDLSHHSQEELELQISAVQGLSGEEQPGTLIMPLMSQYITQSGQDYQAWQYRQAVEIAQLKDEELKEKRIKQGGVELKKLQESVTNSPHEFSEIIKENIATVFEALEKCDKAFSNLFPDACPHWRFFRESLEEVQKIINTLYVEQALNSAEEKNVDVDIETPKTVEDREDVLLAVINASNYFLTHEPHSPVAYLLQRATRWANLPLTDLMEEIFPDTESYNHYCRVAGLPTNPDVNDF